MNIEQNKNLISLFIIKVTKNVDNGDNLDNVFGDLAIWRISDLKIRYYSAFIS